MKHRSRVRAILWSLLISVSAVVNTAKAAEMTEAAVKRGEALYQTKCAACHSIEYNGIGPAHKGLIGKKAGARHDYNYSNALKASSVLWSKKTLDQWLANPEKLIPGQKMGVSVPSAKERADLIAFLVKQGG